MTKTERAYLAGLIDGEGCISMFVNNWNTTTYGHPKRRGTPRGSTHVRLHIGMCDRAVIQWAVKMATPITGPRVTASRIERPPNKPLWYAVWRGERAVALVDAVGPYLRVKRKQAEIIRRWVALSRRTINYKGRHGGSAYPAWVIQRRDRYIEKMRALNRRGLTPSPQVPN